MWCQSANRRAAAGTGHRQRRRIMVPAAAMLCTLPASSITHPSSGGVSRVSGVSAAPPDARARAAPHTRTAAAPPALSHLHICTTTQPQLHTTHTHIRVATRTHTRSTGALKLTQAGGSLLACVDVRPVVPNARTPYVNAKLCMAYGAPMYLYLYTIDIHTVYTIIAGSYVV